MHKLFVIELDAADLIDCMCKSAIVVPYTFEPYRILTESTFPCTPYNGTYRTSELDSKVLIRHAWKHPLKVICPHLSPCDTDGFSVMHDSLSAFIEEEAIGLLVLSCIFFPLLLPSALLAPAIVSIWIILGYGGFVELPKVEMAMA